MATSLAGLRLGNYKTRPLHFSGSSDNSPSDRATSSGMPTHPDDRTRVAPMIHGLERGTMATFTWGEGGHPDQIEITRDFGERETRTSFTKDRTPNVSPSRKAKLASMDVDDSATAQTVTNTQPMSRKAKKEAQETASKTARTTRRAERTGVTGTIANVTGSVTYPFRVVGSAMWRHKLRTFLGAGLATAVIAPSAGDINRNWTCENDLVPFDANGKPPEAIIQGGKWLPGSYFFTDGMIKGSSVHCPVSKMQPDGAGNSVVLGGYNTMFQYPDNQHYKGTIDHDGNSFTASDRAIGFVRGPEKDGLMRTYQNRWAFENYFVTPDGKVRGWPAEPGKATYGFAALGNTGPDRAQIYLTKDVPSLVPGMTFNQFKALWEKVPAEQRGNVTKAIAALAHRFQERA